MSDPISGKMASQALQQPQESQPVGGGSKDSHGASFKDVISRQSEAAEPVDTTRGSGPVEPAAKTEGVERSRMDNFVKGVLKDEQQIDRMMARCMRGGPVDQKEMLQMQALIYSYSQKVDLATKVVEKATGGLKQVMNTQV
ncbi:MAG: hypothetical protein H0U74_12530 [Bradymonadaceae bacterium]|nr:hypothetical protein [Lujinxingiaceae bacterium]